VCGGWQPFYNSPGTCWLRTEVWDGALP
jgi:hypothetical protein